MLVAVLLSGVSLFLPATTAPQDEPPRQEERLIFNPDEPIDQQLARHWRQDPRNLQAEQFVLKKFGRPDDFLYRYGPPVAKVFFYTIPLPMKGLEEWHRIEVKEGVVRDSSITVPLPNNMIFGILPLNFSS